jgi:hypothetical protein
VRSDQETDALALSNIELFKGINNASGMVKKMSDAFSEKTLGKCSQKLFTALKGEKAKMALDLLFDVPPEKLVIPFYIKEGLDWLNTELIKANKDFITPVEPTALKINSKSTIESTESENELIMELSDAS